MEFSFKFSWVFFFVFCVVHCFFHLPGRLEILQNLESHGKWNGEFTKVLVKNCANVGKCGKIVHCELQFFGYCYERLHDSQFAVHGQHRRGHYLATSGSKSR